MQDDDAPERLSRGSDPELRAALRSMAESAPQTERVARIARNVGLATGVRPELLLPPPEAALTSPANTPALESTSAHTTTSALGAGAKIVAASVVVVTAGLLGHWAATANRSGHAVERRAAVGSSVSSQPHAAATVAASSAQSSRTATSAVADAPKPAPPASLTTATAAPEPAAPPPHLEGKPDRPPPREQGSGEKSRALGARAAPSSGSSRSRPVTAREPPSIAASASPADQVKATPADELGLLHLAQSALQTSPAQALHLAGQHQSEFPRSALAQERELIAISALVRLGRRAEARARAERFRRAYPRSAYERQLSVILPER